MRQAMRGARVLLLAVTTVLVAGCYTSRSMQPATTLGRGQVSIGGDVGGMIVPPYGVGTIGARPSASLGLSYGLLENLDGRVSLGNEGVALQLKFAVFQRREQGGWALSLAPHVGAGFWLIGYGYGAELPVLIGFRPTESSEIVLAPTTKYVNILIDGWAGENRHREWTAGATLSYHHGLVGEWKVGFGAGVFHLVDDPGALNPWRLDLGLSVGRALR